MAPDQPTHPRLSAVVDLLAALTTLTGCFGAGRVRVVDSCGLKWYPAALTPELLAYHHWRLDGPLPEFHAAIDALTADTVPKGYWMKVQASRARREHAARRQAGRRP